VKLVTAIIQPFMLDRLGRALRQSAVTGYTVTETRGFSREAPEDSEYLGARIKIEIVTTDDEVDQLIELITSTVGRHQTGDGVILVTDVAQFVHIASWKADSEASIT